MKVEYKEGERPGYGKFCFSEALMPEAPWSMAIQRGSDKRFLTGKAQNPWVGEMYFIELEGESGQDGSLLLNVGPGIVDRLDQQDVYRVSLKGADGEPQKSQMRIAAINYSPSGSLDNTADLRLEDEQGRATGPEQQTAPQPAPEPAGQIEPEPLDMPERGGTPDKKRHYLRWALLAALVAACVAWFIFDPRNKGEAPPAAPPAGQPSKAQTGTESAEDQVRAFFRSGRMTPKQAAELAARLPKTTPGEKDAIYRLYYFAAENGEPSALMEYGACLDPSLPQWGSIEKNAPDAWNAYRRAPDQDNAAKAMTHLRGWLEDQARLGDKQAERWLREIEK